MGVTENESFPRGGIRVINRRKRKYENDLFAKGVQKPKKMREEKHNFDSNEEIWQRTLKFPSSLTYNKMQEGMLILSCVRHISNLAIQIEFPGLIYGTVTINEISDTFSEKLSNYVNLNNELSSNALMANIISVGQLIPAKVLSVTKTDKGYQVQASISPANINSDKKHNSFKKGQLIWANVVSELDHGYELTVGVKNCRVFLPFKSIEDLKKYDVGEPLFCVIHKMESSSSATTLTVSAKQEHVSKCQPGHLGLSDVIPGMRVELIVEEVSPRGIKGQFLKSCFGYIDKTEMLFHVENVKEGSTISSYVLFVEPITKVTYLTLQRIENLPEPQIELGKIMSAKVASIAPRGLHLTFGKNEMGFVTNKRLLKNLTKEAQLDITNAVRTKYPVGSYHECRILDYNYLQRLYICTFERQLIKENVFCAKDLNVGRIVKVTVDRIVSNGLVVKTGHVQGFVPNLHLSNVEYSENIKAKFLPGMKVDGRVLNITADENIIFTLKQGLVESENCLSALEATVLNSQYTGFVVQTKISGALIAFYGDVKGWLSNKTLNLNSGRYMDPREYFFIGQVVTVWILGFKDDKVLVSLNIPVKKQHKSIQVGQNLNGKVIAIVSNSVEVEVGKNKVKAVIPTSHLSSNLQLCPILQKTYKPGDVLTNLMCVNNVGLTPTVSRREYIEFKKQSLKVYKFHELRKNMLLRCSFQESINTGIYVSPLIKDYPEQIFIPIKNCDLNKKSPPLFENQQLIMTKVLNVDANTKKIDLCIVSEKPVDKDSNARLSPLIQAIEDIEHIIFLQTAKNSKLTEYKIGSRVRCRIHSMDETGNCLVTLTNGIDGIIPAHLKSSNCTVGTVVEGVALEYDFSGNFLQICCKNSVNQKVNKIQDGFVNKSFYSSCLAKIILITKFYALAILIDKQCKKQLLYLPLCSTGNKLVCGGKIKVVICRRVGTRIIGLPKELLARSEKKIDTHGIASRKKGNLVNHLQADCGNSSELSTVVARHQNSIEDIQIETIPKDDSVIYNNETVMSGIRLFYTTEDSSQVINELSSEEEEGEKEHSKKKRKLSSSERTELARKEEHRISKLEKELAETATMPQSAEQFERLLLANPNSSELWLQYISMHVSATELDKARVVGKKAIETINMTLVKEKFNIWIALLNLENMYGTKESFEKRFDEAIKYNDSLEIYLSVIKMLAVSGKLLEMEEKIKKVRTKERNSTKMWLELGQLYYSLNKYREARNVKEAALKSIQDKKKQFDVIIRFGIMEFQLGDLEEAIANFETILDIYPSKVNIWIIYVDQLVKRKNFNLARKVLERAVEQKFNVKIMRTLFQKFINFEEQYGTTEAVEKVKNMAREYVATLSTRPSVS